MKLHYWDKTKDIPLHCLCFSFQTMKQDFDLFSKTFSHPPFPDLCLSSNKSYPIFPTWPLRDKGPVPWFIFITRARPVAASLEASHTGLLCHSFSFLLSRSALAFPLTSLNKSYSSFFLLLFSSYFIASLRKSSRNFWTHQNLVYPIFFLRNSKASLIICRGRHQIKEVFEKLFEDFHVFPSL